MKRWQELMMLLLVAGWMGASQAQVYKWTDAQGKVHYGDRKDGAGAKQEELKLKVPPAPAEPASLPGPAIPAWATQPMRPLVFPEMPRSQPQTPQSLSGGKENGTDASRCALARDVLSGAVRHGNGAKTDQNDRDIATADVKRFCR